MQDRPDRDELLKGVQCFLLEKVLPELEEPLRFHTRVAANLLKIIGREMALEPKLTALELERLSSLLDEDPGGGEASGEVLRLNEELAQRIRQGQADSGPWRAEVLAHLKQTLLDKLAIANPGMIDKAQRVD
jgi:uncharacterized protein DUF6285